MAWHSREANAQKGVKKTLTVTSDGLALSELEAVSALEGGDLAVREEGKVLGLLGVTGHSLGLDDLELDAIVGGGTENLEMRKQEESKSVEVSELSSTVVSWKKPRSKPSRASDSPLAVMCVRLR